MAVSRQKKEKIVKDLNEKISKQKVMIFTGIDGLKVKEFNDLRKKLKKADSNMEVAKKTLLKITLKENKIDIDPKRLAGELAMIFGFSDEIAPAKVAYDFSQKNNRLKILGGFFEGQFRTGEEMASIAQLPGRDQLLAKLVGSIASPMSGFLNVCTANTRNFVYLLTQLRK